MLHDYFQSSLHQLSSMASHTEMLRPKERDEVAETSMDFDEEGGAVPTSDTPVGEEPKEKKNILIPVIASIVFCLLLIALTTMIVVLVSGSSDGSPDDSSSAAAASYSNEEFEEIFMEIPSNESCYAYSQEFASKPHVAGMTQTRVLGAMFGDILEELGTTPYVCCLKTYTNYKMRFCCVSTTF